MRESKQGAFVDMTSARWVRSPPHAVHEPNREWMTSSATTTVLPRDQSTLFDSDSLTVCPSSMAVDAGQNENNP